MSESTTTRLAEIDAEIRELEESIEATRTHGILYYCVLVVIVFLGFAIGYATHAMIGIALIVTGLALVAYREMWHYRQHVTKIEMVVSEKRREKKALEARQ